MIKEPNIKLADENQFYLPVGIQDEDGKIYRIVELRPMDGEVEENMGDAKVKTNSGKILTELVYGVLDKIEGFSKVNKDVVRHLTIPDRDFLMAMNFVVSFGENLEFEHKCNDQNCKANNIVKVNVPKLETTYLEDSEPRVLKFALPNGVRNSAGNVFKNIEVRFPTGEDQEAVSPILKNNAGQANTTLLTRITLSIKDDKGEAFEPVNFNTFKKMSKKDRDFINKQLKDSTPGINFEVKYTCSGCGEENTARIPVTSFLQE